MYKFAVSVRAYTIGTRRGYDLNTAAGCIAAANDLMKHPCSAAGKRTITELYRAGGLGVYQIAKLIKKTLKMSGICVQDLTTCCIILNAFYCLTLQNKNLF